MATDDALEGNEEPLGGPQPELTPEQHDEQDWAHNAEWHNDPHYEPFRWAFDELETIFGKGRVAIGCMDFGWRIGCGVKMRFSNGVVVRNAIYLRMPAGVEGEQEFNVNDLDRDDALVWIRTEAKLIRARASMAARAEWKERHPEESEDGPD